MEFLIILVCFSLSSFFKISVAADIIAASQTIRDGETIVSAGGIFELGFFSPGNSKYRYLGIWYKKISSGTVVWVGNRETPLIDSSGVLKINESGNLILFNQNNTIIWSSNASRIAHDPVAQLLDSGNLVVRNENDHGTKNYLWQSFNHPTNTFLPGMKLGRSSVAGLNLYLSSWKSIDDPSQGDFTYQMDPSGLQFVVKKRSVVKARSGPWNGVGFSGMSNKKPNNIYKYTFVYNQEECLYSYEVLNRSHFTRKVLDSDGILQRLTWIDRTGDWTKVLSMPKDSCDSYALCGAYDSCKINNFPPCGCLNGFVPKIQQDWDKADWSSGCIRRTQLDCMKGDGFRRYTNVKLPDILNTSISTSMTLEECKLKCLMNCSCMAYAKFNVRGNGCFLWFDDLIDIKQLIEDGQDIHIRMASSEMDGDSRGGSNQKKQSIIMASSVLLTGILLLGIGINLVIWKKKQNRQGGTEIMEFSPETTNNQHVTEEDQEIPHFDLSTIANATNNFSSNNMLGEGGFGPVFKGVLKNGQQIAVKRLSKSSRQGLIEFKNEVKCIAKLQHRNLVKLLGYCVQLEEKILIYEYMLNRSLDFYIIDEMRIRSLDWHERLHIINGISRGLLYLHHDSRLRIIHRDLKLSNILLDNEMNPKISDFGMARIFGVNETEANTRRVVGTFGYMSPEYVTDGLFSIKSDVFSFGVMVLEIVSGKRNRRFSHSDHQHNLLGHAWLLFEEGRHCEFMDASMLGTYNPSEVLRTIHIGLLCVQHCPEERPNMSAVVLMLSSEGTLPQPKEPGFFPRRRLTERKGNEIQRAVSSVNGVSVTMIEGR